MKLGNVNILQCRFGLKITSAQYFNKLDSHNYKVEDEEFPHPDLLQARKALVVDLAKAFYIEGEESEYFSVNGFVIDEGDGITTVNISGQMTNSYEYITNVKSGKIPLNEENEDLKLKIETVKTELFKYFFEDKTTQGKLPGFEKQDLDESYDEEPVIKETIKSNGEE